MADKINVLYNAMINGGWKGALVTDPMHIYYLTGFASEPHERFLGLLLVDGEEPMLIVPALDEEKARESSSVSRIITHTDTDNPYELLSRFIGSGIDSFAIEKEHVSVARYEILSTTVGARRYVDLGPVLRDMRVRKSADEVQRLKHAVRLVEDVLRDGLTHVREGMTEVELVAELEYRMKKLGADGPSFDTTVLFGTKTAMPHGEPGTKKLAPGDLLMIDMGVYANGYASDITRTFAFGSLTSELEHIYNTVLQANLAGIAAARPGVTCASVDQAARAVVEAAGYGAAFNHRVGHGLGLGIHEYPSLHGANEDPLVEGLVFTVEPGIYIAGQGGVRIEDDVLVTADGVEVLTSFPKELTILA
ncbi:Xaa-Pro peptidase family protein [Paenibacillus sp. P96]|uniref:Xaa-Pro peptidase family protein n=1 Tax=Paenibacillus zeirhizosphaerae TaxID=2987519 RepID=A0ABT9FKR0_9BACL|nr:Xaa-Pro peptidase family protein [Paenibacillus sp. P96]MDP4095317.1 Xaa-Pro peptidase family protein [Paenibacillus sp. P96]